MAMQNWKSFLMPYEQAVDELKIKLKSIRKEAPEWLWERWDSYLYENGTKRDNRFRQTTSRMNTQQAQEYKELLIAFYEDIEEQKEMYNTYNEHFNESDTAFLLRMSKEAKRLYSLKIIIRHDHL